MEKRAGNVAHPTDSIKYPNMLFCFALFVAACGKPRVFLRK